MSHKDEKDNHQSSYCAVSRLLVFGSILSLFLIGNTVIGRSLDDVFAGTVAPGSHEHKGISGNIEADYCLVCHNDVVGRHPSYPMPVDPPPGCLVCHAPVAGAHVASLFSHENTSEPCATCHFVHQSESDNYTDSENATISVNGTISENSTINVNVTISENSTVSVNSTVIETETISVNRTNEWTDNQSVP
jgi:hypothetical protein